MSRAIKTRWPGAVDLTDQSIAYITDMVNAIYDEAEKGLWKVSDSRTNAAEIKSLLKNKQLLLAVEKNTIVGCIQLVPHGAELMEFGMLAVHDNFRGAGIGVTLIKAAEQIAAKEGYKTMKLELLEPHNFKHPGKERLKNWYKDSGYEPKLTRSFADVYPEKSKLLATECDFTEWTKSLERSKLR